MLIALPIHAEVLFPKPPDLYTISLPTHTSLKEIAQKPAPPRPSPKRQSDPVDPARLRYS